MSKPVAVSDPRRGAPRRRVVPFWRTRLARGGALVVACGLMGAGLGYSWSEGWIAQGADYTEHWAFIAPRRAPLPAVVNTLWPQTPIDRFVLARLAAENDPGGRNPVGVVVVPTPPAPPILSDPLSPAAPAPPPPPEP